MLHTLKLLLPALFPSWNYFDFIAPSPRIQFALLCSIDESPDEWVEFRPRPLKLSFPQMLGRMFWNPEWNESLFMVSCAERLIEKPTQHSEDEIFNRIINDLATDNSNPHLMAAKHLQFRLLLVQRKNRVLQQEVVFLSRIESLPLRDEV